MPTPKKPTPTPKPIVKKAPAGTTRKNIPGTNIDIIKPIKKAKKK